MIRAIIFAVFVVPIISLVLDKTQKATKKENKRFLLDNRYEVYNAIGKTKTVKIPQKKSAIPWG